MNLIELIGLVISPIIGSGVFNLMHDMATGAGVGSIIIGWIITAVGMLSLAFTFQHLTIERPDLNTGIYSYATAGFGRYMGFNAAWGYWLSTFLGTVGYSTFLMSSVSYFFPIFGNGQNIWSILVASIILWICHFMILRGQESASFINIIITIAKLVPIMLAIFVMIISFKLHIFEQGFWYTPSGNFQFFDVLKQVKSTMLSTVWVFIGIEGAVVFSGKAKRRKDIGTATILGIAIVLLIYMLVTILAFGVMSRNGLSHLNQPAMANLLQSLVGKWGAIIVNLGLIISVVGAWLSFTMFAAEVPHEAAKLGNFPKLFSRENKYHAPINSLIITNTLVQLLMFSFLFTSGAYNLFYSIASAAILIPYMFSSFYQLKYSIFNHNIMNRKRNIILGMISSIYTIWLLYAAGISYILLMMILFALGIPAYFYLQKYNNHNVKVFTSAEKFIAIIISCLAIIAIISLSLGFIHL